MDAVTAIKGISKTVEDINQNSMVISVAIDQQGSATKEIARSVEKAATGANNVISNVSNLTNAAYESGQAAKMVLESSKNVGSEAEQMSEEVGKFIADIRTM